ncbi:23S rRNA (uracil(747)-C(5))-methyltransferase RlmC [uncultured Zhongshania sp.]|uniref:23S rRNA (uracil(747)-C(5))-methyltransferase RlmC n=1 Tax=uncultured Zhongshania sp. TaxID=1642288 RepID=UPI0025E37502|nr:23S rRNA (uracil(747)-C(5))-methyltransferase RlmC [uncultured Zhongshania sp.]
MDCQHYNSYQCRSCQWLDTSYTQQLAKKEAELLALLAPLAPPPLLATVSSPQFGFRYKAKMVVLGSAKQVKLGILSPKGKPVSICDCPLYPEQMQSVLQALEDWLTTLNIAPYDIKRRSGELKYLLLNQNEVGIFMLRLVLRSEDSIPLITAALPALLSAYPQIETVSANIQAVHAAILEGPVEQLLQGTPWLRQTLNGIPLYQRPKGFFQTNPNVAEKLYATAARWLSTLPIHHIWDLYCGSGGFGLHCLTPERTLSGIEIEAEAIACAMRSAKELGIESKVNFRALDSAAFTDKKASNADTIAAPDIIIVNPPRRGLGSALCEDLCAINPPYILYSSCNPQTLAKDLIQLPSYRIQTVQLFDMFPNTAHYEVLVLLTRI